MRLKRRAFITLPLNVRYGQERTSRAHLAMSALPLKADKSADTLGVSAS